MKLRSEPRWLVPAVLGLSLAAMALRFGVYRIAVDEKGLLIPAHPMQLVLWIIAAAAAVAALLFCGSESAPRRDLRLEALGECMAAVGIALTIPGSLRTSSVPLDGIHLAMALVSAAALMYAGVRRLAGKEAHILCYGATCVFFALHVICRYRGWSAHPQLQDYLFPVLGTIACMIFAYFRCVPQRFRLRRITALVGCLACLAAAGHSSDAACYLGCGIWMITNLHAPGSEL